MNILRFGRCRRFAGIVPVLFLFLLLFSLNGGMAFAVVKFAHVAPPFHGQSKGVEAFAAYVKEKTAGRIDIATFPAGQLGGELSLAEQVQNGSLQLATITTAVMQNFVPQSIIMDMPFLFPDEKTAYAVFDDEELQQKFFSYYPEKGFIAIGWTENGFRDFTNSRGPVRTPADMKGLKVRVINAPIYIDIFRALGASPTGMPFPEIYNALQTGVVDAQENPLLATVLMNFTDVNKYVTLTHHSITECLILVSPDYWGTLSDADRQIFRDAAKAAIKTNRDVDKALENNLPKKNISIQQYAKETGIELTILNKEERAAFREAVRPVWEKYRPIIGDDLFYLVQKKIAEYQQ